MTGPYTVVVERWDTGGCDVEVLSSDNKIVAGLQDMTSREDTIRVASALCGILNSAPKDEPLAATLARLAEGKGP